MKKVKYAGLGKENGFGSAELVKGTAMLCTCSNKYGLTLVIVFNWRIIMIGPGGLLLVVPRLFAVPVYGGVEKNRLCEK